MRQTSSKVKPGVIALMGDHLQTEAVLSWREANFSLAFVFRNTRTIISQWLVWCFYAGSQKLVVLLGENVFLEIERTTRHTE